MRYLKAFLVFWYDFIVGDDWTIAAGVAAIMAVAWALGEAGVDAWWLFLLAIIALLGGTILRAVRQVKPR
ncbi:MAG: hypothetical protein QM753_17640 [Thermomicrobiales bacterium]